jgi:hypothetical protein
LKRRESASTLGSTAAMRTRTLLAATAALAAALPSVVAASTTAGGDRLWVSRFGRPNYGDAAYAVGVSPDASRVFVTGSTNSQSGPTAATVAYDASTGTKLWDASPDLGDTGYALAVSPDGSKVFVTGESWTPNTGYDAATVAFMA